MDFIRVELEEKYIADVEYDDSDDYVHIICKSYGQIKVEAQLGGSWRDNWVKLLLNTDQTVLNKVIQQCNSILKN